VRVKTLMEMLNRYSPEDNLCVLFWDKDSYAWSPDDEYLLTDEAWDEVCEEFDNWPDAGSEVGEWIADAVGEKGELK